MYVYCIYQLPFGCPTANFVPLLRGQPHSLDVNNLLTAF